MKNKRKTLGWLGFGAAVVWLYYDYQANLKRAIMAGWATIALTLAHIFV